MTRLLEWLLGLERIRLRRDHPLSLHLATPPEPWMLATGLVLALVLVILAYRIETANRWTKLLLGACRLSVILIVMALVSQPVLVLSRNRVDPSVVAVLIDESTSMSVLEPPVAGAAPRRARWTSAASLLADPGGLFDHLVSRHHVAVWSFADSARKIGVFSRLEDRPKLSDALALAGPRGARTDLPAALADVLAQTRGSRLAALLVLSDGRQTMPVLGDVALAAARARAVPVHAVEIGSDQPRRNVRLASAWCEPDVFARDTVGVQLRLRATGYDQPVPVTIELRDTDSGARLALERLELTPRDADAPAELLFRPTQAGRFSLVASVLPRKDEDDATDNEAPLAVQVHDESIRVLYVESEPRFEYRYLKNTILRESSFESSILLLSAARGFAQEGTLPIRRFPSSAEELNAYHVVLLGDVDPHADAFSPAQLRLLVDFVSRRGGGIGFLAGERAMPRLLRQTPLEPLLPVRLGSKGFVQPTYPLTTAFAPLLTGVGRRHSLFRLDLEPARGPLGAVRRADSLASLPGWYWYAPVASSAPGAEVLAVHPSASAGDVGMPLIALGRYGAGRTFYQGSDDTWRWRRSQGEGYYDAYWVKVIRMLAQPARFGSRRGWRLETERRDNPLGEPVRLKLIAADTAAAGDVQAISARISGADDEPLASVALHRVAPQTALFEGEYWTTRRGPRTAAVDLPDTAADVATTAFNVIDADAEAQNHAADPAFLRRLAVGSGGHSVKPESAAALADAIQSQSVLVPDDLAEPIWDTRLALLLFVLPIAIEWVIRKLRGLA